VPLSDQQLHGYLELLVAAGNETTRNAIAGGVAALVEHRDQAVRLASDPDGLVETAVEEILRWASPVIQFARQATRDTTVGGVPIPAGDRVVLWYPSANRDERQFPEPYRFDVGRAPNQHLAFGHGPHFCLGANLARWELRAAFRELAVLLPSIELADPPRSPPTCTSTPCTTSRCAGSGDDRQPADERSGRMPNASMNRCQPVVSESATASSRISSSSK